MKKFVIVLWTGNREAGQKPSTRKQRALTSRIYYSPRAVQFRYSASTDGEPLERNRGSNALGRACGTCHMSRRCSKTRRKKEAEADRRTGVDGQGPETPRRARRTTETRTAGGIRGLTGRSGGFPTTDFCRRSVRGQARTGAHSRPEKFLARRLLPNPPYRLREDIFALFLTF